MPKAILVVQSGPVSAEREDEYNSWYDHTHLGEVCQVPGFTGARRFRLSDQGLAPNEPGTPSYVAIYEMDTDDLHAAMQELVIRATDGRIKMSDAMCMDPMPTMTLYESAD
jgi:hypothetical protein